MATYTFSNYTTTSSTDQTLTNLDYSVKGSTGDFLYWDQSQTPTWNSGPWYHVDESTLPSHTHGTITTTVSPTLVSHYDTIINTLMKKIEFMERSFVIHTLINIMNINRLPLLTLKQRSD